LRQKYGAHYESEHLKMAPHTMVISRGDVEKDIKNLVLDLRKVMEPFTASSLKDTKKNTLKDFVAIAGPLHVTHLIALTQTEHGDYMKLMRMPRGPTLHFKLEEYSLTGDVLSNAKKGFTHQKQFLYQPLLILNGFASNTNASANSNAGVGSDAQTDQGNKNSDFHQKLLSTTLQNMFPPINVTMVKLDEIRRCVLFNYNKEEKTIDFRQ
jgi:ribosome biogenesis protein SSF1/2